MALAATALMGIAPPSIAQDQDQDQKGSRAGALEEVIVTATKREESIMQVPISISTLSGEKLDAIEATGEDIRVLRGRVPSLNIESSFGRLFPRFYIRGWGNTDFDINASQPVSLVYDDVVQENPILKGFPIFDTELIEVLRGPQGTLFGRNTPAGVVHVRSRKPTQDFGGYGKLSITQDDRNFEGAIGGGSGHWATRLSVKYMKRDDWVTNTERSGGPSLGGYEDRAARLQFLYENDDFTALFNIHKRSLDGTARLFRANIIQRGTNGGLVRDFNIDTVSLDGRNDQQMDQLGAVMRLDWNLGRTTLTSITGYETFDSWSVGDIDGGIGGVFEVGYSYPGFIPFAGETGDGVDNHQQITQEFRLASNDWGKLDWQAGLFYFDENLHIYTKNYNTNFGGGVNGEVFQQQYTKAWALFGSVDYDITSDLTARAGLRYSDDSKDYWALRTLSPLSFLGVGPLGPVPADANGSEVSWDFSLTRMFSDNTSAYARVAKGFRAPSIQGRILFGDTVSVAKSETVVSYEIGVKSNFAGGRGRVSADWFYYTVDNVQLTAVGGSANFNQVVNADNAIGQGVELDGEFMVTDNFLVTLGMSYNHTEINDPNLSVTPCGQPVDPCKVYDPPDPKVPGAVLIDGNPFPQAPEWIFNATARWGIPYSNGEFYLYGDWFWRDQVNFFLYESREYRGGALGELGLRAGYTWDDGRYDLAVFGRNILDTIVVVGGIDFNNLTGFVNEPRRVGAELRINF